LRWNSAGSRGIVNVFGDAFIIYFPCVGWRRLIAKTLRLLAQVVQIPA
jgi:hypothetical protein